ncbi:MAG: carbohydrate kinase [Spirulina sp. SIO3F2]|nr:carbohydrate kinase [Spirulina sp. SIO3F2]
MARVICIGELLWDYVAQEVGVAYSEVQQWSQHLGGAPANVACGLQQLGLSTALISCVGSDAAGQALIDACTTQGIEIKGIQQHPLLPTRQVHILRSQDGDRTVAGFGPDATHDFADRHLQATQLPVSLFETAEYLVLGTLAWAAPENRQALTRALELADQFQTKVFLDVNWRPLFWENPETAPALMGQLWPRIDFLKLSAEEAQFLFKTTEAAAIARTIDSLEGVWITNGAQGAISYYLSGHTGQVQPFKVAAVDTTGAGDSFVAGLIAQLSQYGLAAAHKNATLVKTLTTYAAAVGALSTLQLGAIAAQPTPAQVEQFLAQQ